MAVLEENKSYPNRKNERRYLLRGLVHCATCGGACTGHNSSRRGKKDHYYACNAAKTYNFGAASPHKGTFVRAEWLEELVWSDVRRFMEDPGEVLERLREQHDAADDAEEFEAGRKELAKRLAAKQAEKDRYVRAYAQGHISEEKLDAYLAELKEQIDRRTRRRPGSSRSGGAWPTSRRTRPRGSRSASSSSGCSWSRSRSAGARRVDEPRSR